MTVKAQENWPLSLAGGPLPPSDWPPTILSTIAWGLSQVDAIGNQNKSTKAKHSQKVTYMDNGSMKQEKMFGE